MKYKKPIPIITDKLCCYNCGNKANYKTVSGKLICDSHRNKCPTLKRKNSDNVKKCYDNGRDAKKIYSNISDDSKKRMAWSKGLKKEFDSRVSRPHLLGKRFASSLTGHTQETKDRLSIIRIKKLENSPHIEWFKLSNGLKVQGKWEFNVGEKLISSGYHVKRTKVYYDLHRRYTPDFNIGDNIFVEVKGWLSNRDIKKYKKVLDDNPNIKIFLIRNEGKRYNYDKFISGKIKLYECEDLRTVLGD